MYAVHSVYYTHRGGGWFENEKMSVRDKVNERKKALVYYKCKYRFYAVLLKWEVSFYVHLSIKCIRTSNVA